MKQQEVINHRLTQQQIEGNDHTSITELMHWLGPIQAQDYAHSKWALGLRLPHVTNREVEQAIADRKLVRGWILRGTLHTVAAQDMHWLLDLVASRIISSSKGRNRQLGLDEETFARCEEIFLQVLKGKKELTRDEIATILQEEGITAEGQRLYHILHRAGLDQVICFGSRREKQFTFTLLDEYVPKSQRLQPDDPLLELARRYFTSRAPATLEDFVWWSGQTKTAAKKVILALDDLLDAKQVAGQIYYLPKGASEMPAQNKLYLIPAFDEYVIAYRDRTAALPADKTQVVISKNGIFYPAIVDNGIVIGTWKRKVKKEQVIILPELFETPTAQTKKRIEIAAQAFADFLEVEDWVVEF